MSLSNGTFIIADDILFGQAELSYFGSSWETFGSKDLGQCFIDLNVHMNTCDLVETQF